MRIQSVSCGLVRGRVHVEWVVEVQDITDVHLVQHRWGVWREKGAKAWTFGLLHPDGKPMGAIAVKDALRVLDALVQHGGFHGRVEYTSFDRSYPVVRVEEPLHGSGADTPGAVVIDPGTWVELDEPSIEGLKNTRIILTPAWQRGSIR